MAWQPECRARSRCAKLARLCIALGLALLPVARTSLAEEAAMWSVAPLSAAEPPAVQRSDWVTNEIDRFTLARLEAEGLSPAPPAEPAALVRRLYFDLWGLPPSPEEVDAFVTDDRPDAYQRLVDRLLDSPHFGERWGRYWLDIVRYADTNGYERDAPKEGAWRYRDWVIRAIAEDLPYDQFVTEQLAGDELTGADEASRIATGFLRVGTFDDEPNDPLQYKFEQLDDLMHTTATAFLALTLKCARCHDHKFDPIPQRDYYAVLNCFVPGKPLPGDVLGFTDEAAAAGTPVHLLSGGDPRHQGEAVPPGFLSLLPQVDSAVDAPPAESATTTRRRQLAEWIVDDANPLTPRVAVNRLWQHHFGQGLSRSSDNFGNTGLEPTHPELLDWLARQLIAGGWRQKPLHRLILLSSTYRQSSAHPNHDEYAGRDPENLLLWHFPRARLDVEALRDAMLATSGELDLRAGGPGFVPELSAEAVEGLSKKENAWKPSPPEEQNRRSVYLYVQRSLVPPLWTVFDFADTTQPCCQRNTTTVAPQALALLNNAWVHGRSRALARRGERETAGGSAAERIDRLWRLAFGRLPRDDERELALAHVLVQTERFSQAPGNTVAVGGSPAPVGDSPAPVGGSPAPSDSSAATAEQAAWASLCHVLLNANEFVYVD